MKHTIIAGVIAAAGTLLVAAPAHAENYDYPGSCLAVRNDTGRTLAFTIDNPQYAGPWVYAVGEYSTATTGDGRLVQSSSGAYNLTPSNAATTSSWAYDVYMNRDAGCNGSWIVTFS
ncbi:hypothetical protein [Nocardia sp. NPDC004711]